MSSPHHSTSILSAENLTLRFPNGDSWFTAVNELSFELRPGEVLGIVGESGSGKSLTAAALLRMAPDHAAVDGEIVFDGRDVPAISDDEVREMRGAGIALVPQNPLAALNPVVRIGVQLEEAMLAHGKFSRSQAKLRAAELLELVGIPDANSRLRDFPHEFSGGMRQRLMIAMALSNEPKVLIADEPTTALDVTIQAQIVDLLIRVNQELGTSIVLITHNLGVAAKLCDRVLVMYAGRIVEEGITERILSGPSHPYTRALLHAVPRLDSGTGDLHSIPGRPPNALERDAPGCAFAPRCERASDHCLTDRPSLMASESNGEVACWHPWRGDLDANKDGEKRSRVAHPDGSNILTLDKVTKRFGHQGGLRRGQGLLTAVDEVSLDIHEGETLGLVGESGSGKSTLARLALGLDSPSSGNVLFRSRNMRNAPRSIVSAFRRDVQIVFQDPKSSLNPWLTVEQSVTEPLRIQERMSASERRVKAVESLERVGLQSDDLRKHISEFSGGQQQRIALARALILEPALVVCDEPVSALDVSVQAQIVNLLISLQSESNLSYLFVAHDLAVVQSMSHRIAVMYLGRIVETGPASIISTVPLHPYTASLYSAVPVPDVQLEKSRPKVILSGDIPNPRNQPPGCPFQDRCPIGPTAKAGREKCITTRPSLVQFDDGQSAACHFPGELRIATLASSASSSIDRDARPNEKRSSP